MLNDALFHDDAVPLALLRERAHNLRWAEQEAGVIPLTAADPDFAIAPAIRERIARHAHDGVMSYGPPTGLPAFRGAVATWMRSTRQLDCDADAVFATDGAASAMAVVARASLQAGDEVLIPDPVDFLFRHTVERAGATAVPVPLRRRDCAGEFIEAMHRFATPRTRMLWLCNPGNPLGTVHDRDWLAQVATWAIERGWRILCDEVWSDIVFEPHRHVCLASLSPEIARHVATVYGFSKGYALAGLRVGCVVCPDAAWQRRIVEASGAGSTVFGVATLSQQAAIAALEEAGPWLQTFLQHLHAQRALAVRRIRRWPGVSVDEPQGSYVVFPRVAAITPDVERWCEAMKREARVATVPGSPRWFGAGAAGHVRLCFATSRGILTTALDRIEGWLQAPR